MTADSLLGHVAALRLLKHLQIRGQALPPATDVDNRANRAPGDLPRERFGPMAPSWRKYRLEYRSAVGIGKRTLMRPLSVTPPAVEVIVPFAWILPDGVAVTVTDLPDAEPAEEAKA